MKGGRAAAFESNRRLAWCIGGLGILLAAAALTPSGQATHKPPVYLAVENSGLLRMGLDSTGNFGVHESQTYPYLCTTSCATSTYARPMDAISRHGVDVTGLRYDPSNATQNIELLNADRSGGWGVSYTAMRSETPGGQVPVPCHAPAAPACDKGWYCVLDESLDCDGRGTSNRGDLFLYGHQQAGQAPGGASTYAMRGRNDLLVNYGESPHECSTYTSPGRHSCAQFDMTHSVQPVNLYGNVGRLAPDAATSPTSLPTVYQFDVMGRFFTWNYDLDGANQVVYRRTLLPEIPTDDSSAGGLGSGIWDAGTKLAFGMRVPDRAPDALRISGTNGFAIPNPDVPVDQVWSGADPTCPPILGPGSVSGGAPYSRSERCNDGMVVEIDLWKLRPQPPANQKPGIGHGGWVYNGEHRDIFAVLRSFLAVAESPDQVQPLLDALKADIWFTAEGPANNGGPPLTLIWAFPFLYTDMPPEPDIEFDVAEPSESPLGWSPSTPCIGVPVTFEANTRQDYPLTLKSNQWTVDGVVQAVNDPRADLTWTFTTAGAHALRLTETNDKGLVGTKDITVTVLDCTPPPLAPTARLDVPTVTLDDCAPATFKFTGMASAIKGRPDQDFVKWSLTFGDGESTGLLDWPPPAFVLHDYLQSGTFVATVLVKDSKGMTDTEIQYVQVCPNRAPIVNGPAKILAQSGTVVTLPVTLGDRDWGAQVTLRLTGLPGTPSIGPIPMPYQGSFTITGLLPGIYPVVAEATDETGATSQWHFPIMVSKRPNPAPDFDHDGVSDSADLCGGQGGAMLDGCQTETGPVGVSITLAPPDQDQDGVPDAADNCATTPNPQQQDLDQDLLGDTCDEDDDGDGISETGPLVDNCPGLANPDQLDQDHDGTGDACRAPVFPRSATATPATWPHARGRDTWTPTTATTFAAALAAVLAGLAWLNRHRLVWLATFSRLAKDKLLDNRLRSRIMEQVQAEPGIHKGALLRRVGKSRNGLDYHLRRLEEEGLLHRLPTAGFVSYYPAGTGPQAEDQVKADAGRALLRAVRAQPALTIAEAARTAGMSHAAASYHLRKFEAAGLVRRVRDGRVARLHAV